MFKVHLELKKKLNWEKNGIDRKHLNSYLINRLEGRKRIKRSKKNIIHRHLKYKNSLLRCTALPGAAAKWDIFLTQHVIILFYYLRTHCLCLFWWVFTCLYTINMDLTDLLASESKTYFVYFTSICITN